MSPGRAKVRVCTWKLRAWFNEQELVRKVMDGRIIARVTERPHSNQRPGLAANTRKQIIRYFEPCATVPLALAQATVCQHGQILRSGFPDPKARFAPEKDKEPMFGHQDSLEYTCGPQCEVYRRRAKAAESLLEDVRQSCRTCEPTTPESP